MGGQGFDLTIHSTVHLP